MKFKMYSLKSLEAMYYTGMIAFNERNFFDFSKLRNPLQSSFDKTFILYLGNGVTLKHIVPDVVLFAKDGNHFVINANDFKRFLEDQLQKQHTTDYTIKRLQGL